MCYSIAEKVLSIPMHSTEFMQAPIICNTIKKFIEIHINAGEVSLCLPSSYQKNIKKPHSLTFCLNSSLNLFVVGL